MTKVINAFIKMTLTTTDLINVTTLILTITGVLIDFFAWRFPVQNSHPNTIINHYYYSSYTCLHQDTCIGRRSVKKSAVSDQGEAQNPILEGGPNSPDQRAEEFRRPPMQELLDTFGYKSAN